MSTIEIHLLPVGRPAAQRYVVRRPSQRTFARRRAAAALLVGVVLAVLWFGVSTVATGRGSEPASAAAARPSNPTPVRVHVVAPGDTLWAIAATARGDIARDDYVEQLIAANGGIASLQVGQRLVLP